MTWNSFVYFALAAVLLWSGGAWLSWIEKRVAAMAATMAGLAVFMAFIMLMWVSLERPPLRTMGETRLWYSLFLPLAGLIVYARWHYRWILTFATIMAAVFIGINLLKPEIHDKTLMPALQSPWFAPHVIVYMFAYAVFGAATLLALVALFRYRNTTGQNDDSPLPHPTSPDTADVHSDGCRPSSLSSIDDLVAVGLSFLTIGMLFGALWAKEAWGHYWSWDPKETWAAITWFAYLAFIHYRLLPRHNGRLALLWLVVCFLLLQMCWWGINYLPSAQQTSVHTYSM